MLNKVKSAIENYCMPLKNSNVLIALSGGADSVALLLALLDLKNEYMFSVKALHVNHNLRGDESLRDQNFVVDLCESLKVPITVECVDVLAHASTTGESTELAARNIRYALFNKHSTGLIATAHTASDNAETILLNVIRGTGLKGLCGIPPVRDNIIRPLIYCSRDDILNYLTYKCQNYVTDSSNNCDDYTRNKIRHHIIPQLKKLNLSFEETALRMSEILREDSLYLTNLSIEKFKQYFAGSLLCESIKQEPKAICNRILLEYCNVLGIKVESKHLCEMFKVVNGEILKTELPQGYYFHHILGGFIAEKPKTSEIFSETNISIVDLKLPQGEFFTVNLSDYKKFHKINNLLFKFAIDCDKIVGSVTLRNRQNGDEYRPVVRNVTKTLRKLLNESKLSFEDKSKLFIIEDANGIIFTSLFGIDERVKVTDESKNIVVFKTV